MKTVIAIISVIRSIFTNTNLSAAQLDIVNDVFSFHYPDRRIINDGVDTIIEGRKNGDLVVNIDFAVRILQNCRTGAVKYTGKYKKASDVGDNKYLAAIIECAHRTNRKLYIKNDIGMGANEFMNYGDVVEVEHR